MSRDVTKLTRRKRRGRRGLVFRHVMVPVDLSDRNERALRAALALATEWRSRVTLFHVIHRVAGLAPGELDAFYGRLVERSERELRQAARPLPTRPSTCARRCELGSRRRKSSARRCVERWICS